MTVPVATRLAAHAAALTAYFADVPRRCPGAPPKLIEAIQYSLTAGGKRLRPALLLETYLACGGTSPHDSSVLSSAAAMELIHTFSLVHDDLPAMDDDDLRRGRPTNHKVFGEALAILAGDAMMTLAFEILAADAPQILVGPLVRELANAAGPAGMIGGQVLDIAAENSALPLAELKRLHSMKTGALLVASCRMGALCAGAPESTIESMSTYARHLGLAFQIVDDILDQTATAEQLGKATNKDQSKGKNTYPILLGLEASKAEAQAQLDAALAALAPLGADAGSLRELAHFVVGRKS